MLRRIALLWALFAAVAGFSLGGGLVLSFQERPQAQYDSTAAAKSDYGGIKNHPTKSLWQRTWDDAIAFYTFVLSVFTFLLVTISATQIGFLIRADKTARTSADAAIHSAKTAEDHLKISIRPLLTIAPLELCDANTFKNNPHIHFGWHNAGNGAATVTKVRVAIVTKPNVGNILTLTEGTAMAPATGIVTSEVNGAIEPGETIDGNRIESALLIPEEVVKIRAGSVLLAVNVTIESLDLLKNPCIQHFPFLYDSTSTKFTRNNLFTEEKEKAKNAS